MTLYIFTLFKAKIQLLPRYKKHAILLNMTAIFSLNSQSIKTVSICFLVLLSTVFGISSISSIAQEARSSKATSANLVSDFTIGNSSYTSQGSGEIVGNYFYTTAHNFTLDQINFLVANGGKFLSVKGQCSRILLNNRVKYNEGVLEVPLSTLNSQKAKDQGLNNPTVLRNNPNVSFINWSGDVLNPNYIYIRGITKNQNGKKEQLLTGNQMFVANGTGLSGGAYKYNEDLSIEDVESKAIYIVGIHVGAATYQGQKINIMWVSNGDGTFSYARYLPDGTIIRVDNLLNSECNL